MIHEGWRVLVGSVLYLSMEEGTGLEPETLLTFVLFSKQPCDPAQITFHIWCKR